MHATHELIPHLFRTEFRKITAVLCKRFGVDYLETAEDIAGETFLRALETWPYQSIPENPSAWLQTVARNLAFNQHKRNHLFASDISPALHRSEEHIMQSEIDLSEKHIEDSQLQMLFAICHPAIPLESQIGLGLRILCGFGIDEIATAFLTNKETINKRLHRARSKLREEHIQLTYPDQHELEERLDAVLLTLYLMFSEGYSSESDDRVLREDLCFEAMEMLSLLLRYPPAQKPRVNALMALMCFHASRFEARRDALGHLILYEDQDERKWNPELISKGMYFIHQAASGEQLSRYHLEAAIAMYQTQKEDTPEKWQTVLGLYDQLLEIQASPVIALNRIYVYAKVYGHLAAIRELEKMEMKGNTNYYSLLGALYSRINPAKSIEILEKAYGLAKTNQNKLILKARMDRLKN